MTGEFRDYCSLQDTLEPRTQCHQSPKSFLPSALLLWHRLHPWDSHRSPQPSLLRLNLCGGLQSPNFVLGETRAFLLENSIQVLKFTLSQQLKLGVHSFNSWYGKIMGYNDQVKLNRSQRQSQSQERRREMEVTKEKWILRGPYSRDHSPVVASQRHRHYPSANLHETIRHIQICYEDIAQPLLCYIYHNFDVKNHKVLQIWDNFYNTHLRKTEQIRNNLPSLSPNLNQEKQN